MIVHEITIIRSAVGSPSAIGLINELKKRNVRIIGVDCDPLSAGLFLCDAAYVIPRGDDPDFLNEMMNLCKIEKPNAILSGPEEEILVLAKNKKLFEELGVLVLCPDFDTIRVITDKKLTCELLEQHGYPIPKRYDKGSVKFPCIIKPRFGRGGKNVYKARNANELKFYLTLVEDPIIQEFIDGVEYTIDTFADLAANPLSIIPRARLQVESGISMKGVTVHDKELIAYSEKMVRNLKLIGPACIQCIRDGSGAKFTEINPRFGGGSILSIKADPTILPNLIRIIKGEKTIPSNGFEEGLVMMRYYSEVFINKSNLKKDVLSRRGIKDI